ncbi:MAG: methionine adenosyltransferase [Armatimonadetes bacterium]|nr:methionine adenosyltransferase [Armatimonadota bacterium]
MPKDFRLTSESVTEGHPDKVCDQVSDTILDYIMANEEDPHYGGDLRKARVAVETLVTTGTCVVAGEVRTECYVPIDGIVRNTIREIGYTRAKFGFDADNVGVLAAIHGQSDDIAQGVDGLENECHCTGAGDQGMMFGYACTETEIAPGVETPPNEYMPLPIMLAHKLARRLAEVRRDDELEYLRPDGKTQVTVEYEDDKPVRVTKVLLAAQHAAGIPHSQLESELTEYVVDPIIPLALRHGEMDIMVNRTGQFVLGGPAADSGVTGRKIIVDTYGGGARHGGGAFSGKDPTKVDRSGAYMARYIAKNVVAAGLADRCELQVSYAIGDPCPFSCAVFCFGTEKIDECKISDIILDTFDLSPDGMIEKLDLRKPIYRRTASYGHFGRNEPGFTWEQLDMVEALKEAAGL